MGIQINNKQVLDMNYLGKKAYSAVLNGDYVFASTLKKVSGTQNNIKDAAALPINKLYLEGNSYQETTSGKNICPSDASDWVLGQWTIDGGTGTYENRIRVNRLVPCKPSTTYYVQTFLASRAFAIRTFKEDGSFNTSIGAVERGSTFTTDENSYYLGITIYSELGGTEDLLALIENGELKPFICLNSETDKSFEPYTNGPSPNPDYQQEIEVIEGSVDVEVFNKNMFNSEICGGVSINGLTTILNTDGSITIKGTPTSNYISLNTSGKKININDLLVDGEKYTISQNIGGYIYLQVDGKPISAEYTTQYITASNNPNVKSKTFVVDKSKYTYEIGLQTGIATSVGENVNVTLYLQLEKGSVATEYEPYKSTTATLDLQDNFIAKIRDVKDELDVVTGKLTKRIGKVVLNGSEEYVAGKRDTLFSLKNAIDNVKKPIYNTIKGQIISDYFETKYYYGDIYTDENNLFYSQDGTADNISHNGIAVDITGKLFLGTLLIDGVRNIDTLKTWLSQNNVEVYYILAEPYEVQLDITKIPLFEGVNNIKIGTNLEPSLTELDYYIR